MSGLFEGLTEPEKPKKSVEDVGTKELVVVPTKVPSVVPTEAEDYIDVVRRAVKWPGKEGANLRLTEEELVKLKAAIRYFEDRGYYTDRTLITRIGLSYIMLDLEENGDESILAKVIDRIREI
jgi:hypothetical protein